MRPNGTSSHRSASHLHRRRGRGRRNQPVALAAALALAAATCIGAAAAAPDDAHIEAAADRVFRSAVCDPDPAEPPPRDPDAVVLIHGLGASADIWKGVVPGLGGTYRIFLYELHGHGKTGPLQDAASASLSGVTAAFGRWLADQGLDHPHLVGHGIGGLIAMQHSFDNPGRVRSLTLIDTGPRPLLDQQRKVDIARSLLQDYDRFVASHFIGISEVEHVNRLAVDMALRADSASLAALLLSSLDWDLTELIPEAMVPMLLIGSEFFLPEEGAERDYLEHYGYDGARTLKYRRIPHSGHYLMLERPTHLAAHIMAWLRDLDP